MGLPVSEHQELVKIIITGNGRVQRVETYLMETMLEGILWFFVFTKKSVQIP